MTPLLSIVTVSRNAEREMKLTADSIALQTFRNFEWIVIDGASTDATVEVARHIGDPESTIIVSEPDRGVYDAMNKGLSLVKGTYVLFLNAGDRLHSADTLQIIADTAVRHDYPGIIYGQTDIVNVDGRKISDRHLLAPDSLTLQSFANGMVVCHQSFVALTELTQPFDLRYRFSADYDWCIRCLQHSRHNVNARCTIADYLAGGQTSANRRRSLAERFKIMSTYFGTAASAARHVRFLSRHLLNRLRHRDA